MCGTGHGMGGWLHFYRAVQGVYASVQQSAMLCRRPLACPCSPNLLRGSVSAPGAHRAVPGIFFDPCPTGDLLGGIVNRKVARQANVLPQLNLPNMNLAQGLQAFQVLGGGWALSRSLFLVVCAVSVCPAQCMFCLSGQGDYLIAKPRICPFIASVLKCHRYHGKFYASVCLVTVRQCDKSFCRTIAVASSTAIVCEPKGVVHT